MKFLILVITSLLLLSCSDDRQTHPSHLKAIGHQAIVCQQDLLWRAKEIQLFDKDQSIVALGLARTKGRRLDVGRSCLEIINMPMTWQEIKISEEGTRLTSLGRATADKGGPIVAAERPPWFMRHIILSSLFVLLTLYTVFMVGVSGGPNHGEHPFIVNVSHLVVFLFLGTSWSYPYYHAYLGVLILAIGFSLWAVRLIFVQGFIVWISRAAMLALYVGLFVLINISTYSDMAEWSHRHSIMLYVKPESRDRIQFLNERDQVLKDLRLLPKMDCWTLCLWDLERDDPPQKVRIIEPSGGVLEIHLNNRPQR